MNGDPSAGIYTEDIATSDVNALLICRRKIQKKSNSNPDIFHRNL